ncbi:retrovirus-related pol polyprotein from transposon TNT 1-94 [Tanacetum coccineum]|uniref:Retrovirus-related pol polyprotein from transposon TNT 1-94 n=1 Tax=Tanacetum coccineum TaxID=301880 RepID=A0ABQ5EXX5_9ASTR
MIRLPMRYLEKESLISAIFMCLDSMCLFIITSDDGYFLGYFFVSKAFRVFNTRRQQVEETYHVTFDESMEAIKFTNTSVDEIGIDDSSRYPPDEFIHKDDPSRQYQANSDISYYHETPHSEDAEGPSDLINTKGTHEQNNRWSKDQHIELVNIISDSGEGMLTRSMAAKLKATSASECLFADFLSETEPKKVFKNKKDEHGVTTKNKARLVTQGYSQEEGFDYDETFAPVARIGAIKIFLTFATYMNFKVFQMDVKIAFLNGKLKKEVYVKHPPSFKSSEFPNYVCKLNKALYGLKQAPKACPDLAGKPVNKTSYRGMIRLLMYLTATRPDIQFSTILCARYQSNLKESHLIVVKRILKYLKVAMSLAKVEYVVAAGCCASILWMKSQLNDYDIHYKMVPIFCDNTSAIAISNNPVLHSRTKHIDIRYHFTKDHILKGDIELHFIPTEYQLADIFTKPSDEPTFTRLKAELGTLNID